jgi:hypothetical protein
MSKTNPADKVEHWPIDWLVPYAKNSRTHSEEQIAQIAASIKEWGFTTAVLVDEKGGIIAGHGRVLAARKLGIDTLPVMVATGWTEPQKRAYVIADNKLALNAGWDNEMLSLELGELGELGFDLDLIGFTALELEGFNPSDLPGEGTEKGSTSSLADRFGIPPFSVLNAREGWWQGRKRAWLALGIQSELGRGENGHHAAPGGSVMVSGYDKNGNRLTGLKNISGKSNAKT